MIRALSKYFSFKLTLGKQDI